jgi:hypothetical protein
MEELSIDETSTQAIGPYSLLLSEYRGPFPWVNLLDVKLTTYSPLLLRLRISAVNLHTWRGDDLRVAFILTFTERRKGKNLTLQLSL